MKENVFSFQLDEALWFKEGQGVRELLGISLEPEITIKQLDQEVRLNGTIELTGEYILADEKEAYDSSSEIQSVRVIHEVERGEEGVHYFSHSFPVEITVPNERVSNINAVLVDIENFDYELPAQNQLRLQAQMIINGINQEDAAYPADETRLGESTTIGPINYQTRPDEQKIFPPPFEREEPVVPFPGYEAPNGEETESDGRWTYKKTQSFNEFFGKEEPAAQETQVEELVNESSEWELTTIMESSTMAHEDAYEAENESTESVHGIKHIFKHLFPNREDSYTQMKMYIVQEDETLATIAERYQVPLKQLEKVNEDKEDVSPGQIVYIPS
ncbi:stage VI sporulation protein D [Halobacillus salinarum]|uniref:Stage VI sporulation protein D n=1 Tax=Halobacillus salinarum TaxID=2932257 RepID=A0ABY4EVP3_9BACI|nr:stage VI sporulation protein D [Halobacillus salinarum]UOQ46241.1 stage VI sporulation protein D [Halobacillus salinarum]